MGAHLRRSFRGPRRAVFARRAKIHRGQGGISKVFYGLLWDSYSLFPFPLRPTPSFSTVASACVNEIPAAAETLLRDVSPESAQPHSSASPNISATNTSNAAFAPFNRRRMHCNLQLRRRILTIDAAIAVFFAPGCAALQASRHCSLRAASAFFRLPVRLPNNAVPLVFL